MLSKKQIVAKFDRNKTSKEQLPQIPQQRPDISNHTLRPFENETRPTLGP